VTSKIQFEPQRRQESKSNSKFEARNSKQIQNPELETNSESEIQNNPHIAPELVMKRFHGLRRARSRLSRVFIAF
jgi:hypothetical protein